MYSTLECGHLGTRGETCWHPTHAADRWVWLHGALTDVAA